MIFTVIIAYLLIINAVSFVVYGVDKYKARHQKWRIPEATLLTLAAIGGAAGALLGMVVFRHKTKHLRFVLLVPLFVLVWAALVYMTTGVVVV
ncbi:DUF1294 domain-containing protein [Porphyromonas levii]|uniref:DUF1294 domain-containing protein n=1 Tax=Porphyromonas levii TaxID=28114 RepID=A0A4Y8WRC2_9PORP|nr:DUF1294 domain-containing protein [Porphyromonas levii]MBR8703846.1 hypothetical protein [Porphyromonas levii]MBR8731008.1 hypothetical protein [Porphyromonas levii]MBR8760304.1 hypothetical protein [Porphyromonas levii]MBR8785417.1 hypothetical protein [Porphyromonas levii]TFH96982.1 DUF1294 domain-containing protein [Porphyromonas levii]